MKIRFLRNYRKYKIGDLEEIEGEELEYILSTKTAIQEDFETDEIEKISKEEDNEEDENGEGVVFFNTEENPTEGLSEEEIEKRRKKTLKETQKTSKK